MARSIFGIKIPVVFDTARLRTSVGAAKTQVRGFAESAKRQMRSLSREMRESLGSRLAGALSLGAVAWQLRDCIKAAADFEQALLGVMAAAAGMGQDMLQARDAAVRLSADGFMSAAQAAQALGHWMKAGFSLEQAQQLVAISRDMAAFGNTTGDAAQAVVDLAKGARTNSIELMENAGWTTRLGSLLGNNIDLTNNAEQRTLFYNKALEEHNKVQGNAAAYLDTTAGRLAQMNKELTDTRVSVGQAFLPALYAMLPAAKWAANAIAWVFKNIEKLGLYLDFAAATFWPNLQLMWLDTRRWSAKMVAEFAVFGQRLVSAAEAVPYIGNLLGLTDAPEQALDSLQQWALQTIRTTRGARQELENELQMYADAYVELLEEIDERYATPSIAVQAPNLPLITGEDAPDAPGESGEEEDPLDAVRDQIDDLSARAATLQDLIQLDPENAASYLEQLEAVEDELTAIYESGQLGDQEQLELLTQRLQLEQRIAEIRAGMASPEWRDSVIAGLQAIGEQAGGLGSVIEDSVGTAFQGLGTAIEDSFAAMVSGSEDAGKAFSQAMLAALASVARGFGQFFLGQAAGELAKGIAGNPMSWAAAAKYTAAAAMMFALAGSLGGIGGSNTGGGPQEETSHGFDRAEEGERNSFTLVLPNVPINPNDPDWQEHLVEALNAAGANNHVVNIRTQNG